MRFRPCLLLSAVAWLAAGPRVLPAAEPEPPSLIVTRAGYYFVVYDTAGEPALVKVTRVLVAGDPPQPPPGGDGPPPADLSPTARQVREWAAEVGHPVSAQALREVYARAADRLEKGELAAADVWDVVAKATDEVLPAVGGGGKWDGFRAKVSELAVGRMQAGELSHPNQVAGFLRDVAAGIGAAAADAPGLGPEVTEKIVRLILRVFDLRKGSVVDDPA